MPCIYLHILWLQSCEVTLDISALLAICAGNSPVTDEFPVQRSVTRSFDVSLICAWLDGWVNNGETGDLRRHRACPLWRHRNVIKSLWVPDHIKIVDHRFTPTLEYSFYWLLSWYMKNTTSISVTIQEIKRMDSLYCKDFWKYLSWWISKLCQIVLFEGMLYNFPYAVFSLIHIYILCDIM